MSLVKVVIKFFFRFYRPNFIKIGTLVQELQHFFGKIAKYLKNGIAQDLPKWLKLILTMLVHTIPLPFHEHFFLLNDTFCTTVGHYFGGGPLENSRGDYFLGVRAV